jgi:hypothetical protein
MKIDLNQVVSADVGGRGRTENILYSNRWSEIAGQVTD